MTPEEQTAYVELQDKLKTAEKERDDNAAKLAERDKDIDELKKINQQLFIRATTPATTDGDKGDEDGEKLFSTDDLLKSIKGGK